MTAIAQNPKIVIAALYRFVALDDYTCLRLPLMKICMEEGVKGTLLLAKEGINGTIAGTRVGIDRVISYLRSDPRFAELTWKETQTSVAPFLRMKVKLKKEIVTLGVPNIDPTLRVGRYATPWEWNFLIDDPDCLVIDTRNDYEVDIGFFKGAVNPATQTFREFPAWVHRNLDKRRHKKIAMYCTGGIRCEKSSSLLLKEGFQEVWQLRGGILGYLEGISESDSRWQGECFVFDSRVALDHSLRKGHFDQCYACRYPITEVDKGLASYEKGVSCQRCYGKHSVLKLARLKERQRQIELSEKRGDSHLGG